MQGFRPSLIYPSSVIRFLILVEQGVDFQIQMIFSVWWSSW